MRIDILREYLKSSYAKPQELKTLVDSFYSCSDVDTKIKLKEEIFNNCIRFIRKKSIEIVGRNSPFLDDAFQSACVGFLYGMDKFEPERNIKFLYYMNLWIVNYIHIEFRGRNIIKISSHEFNTEKGNRLSNKNMLYYDKISKNEYGEITEIPYMIDSQSLNFEKELLDRDLFDKLIAVSKYCFSENEKLIFKLRYLCDEDIKYTEIAKELNITKQAVQSTDKTVLRKLKEFIENGVMEKTIVNKNQQINDVKIILSNILIKRNQEK